MSRERNERPLVLSVLITVLIAIAGYYIAMIMPVKNPIKTTTWDPFTGELKTVIIYEEARGHFFGWFIFIAACFLIAAAVASMEVDYYSEETVSLSDEEKSMVRKRRYWRASKIPQNRVCGNCLHFGKTECPRLEKLINAEPCQKYSSTP